MNRLRPAADTAGTQASTRDYFARDNGKSADGSPCRSIGHPAPKALYLATVAYRIALEEGQGGDDWRIMDPFGLGEGRRRLDTADRLRASDKEFDQQIRRLTRM